MKYMVILIFTFSFFSCEGTYQQDVEIYRKAVLTILQEKDLLTQRTEFKNFILIKNISFDSINIKSRTGYDFRDLQKSNYILDCSSLKIDDKNIFFIQNSEEYSSHKNSKLFSLSLSNIYYSDSMAFLSFYFDCYSDICCNGGIISFNFVNNLWRIHDIHITKMC